MNLESFDRVLQELQDRNVKCFAGRHMDKLFRNEARIVISDRYKRNTQKKRIVEKRMDQIAKRDWV